MTWQPIETAPWDGNPILVFEWMSCPKIPGQRIGLHTVAIRDPAGGWASDIGPNIKPTHWQPLPAPPEERSDG